MKLFALHKSQSEVYLDILSVIRLLVQHRLIYQREVVTHLELTKEEFAVIQQNILDHGNDQFTHNWPEYFCGLIVSKAED